MSRPTPEELISDWQRRKAVKAAERAVVEAAEQLAGGIGVEFWLAPDSLSGENALHGLKSAVSKLREAREK